MKKKTFSTLNLSCDQPTTPWILHAFVHRMSLCLDTQRPFVSCLLMFQHTFSFVSSTIACPPHSSFAVGHLHRSYFHPSTLFSATELFLPVILPTQELRRMRRTLLLHAHFAALCSHSSIIQKHGCQTRAQAQG